MERLKNIFQWKNIDYLILGFIAFLYWSKWRSIEPRELLCVSERTLVLTAINNAVNTGIIAVSILLPLLFGIVFLRERSVKCENERKIIDKYFLKPSGYFVLSLFFGLINLFRLPTMVNLETNLAYDTGTVFYLVCQLLFLLFGVLFFLLLGYKLHKKN